jgi:hypothetical protein
LIAIVVAVVIAGLVLAVWPREVITKKNFARIQVGMTQSDLYDLLGAPQYQTVEIGLVNGPESYATNSHISAEEKHRRGFRQYRRDQWTSAECTISAISDAQGRVVCRYVSSGERAGWPAFFRSLMPHL